MIAVMPQTAAFFIATRLDTETATLPIQCGLKININLSTPVNRIPSPLQINDARLSPSATDIYRMFRSATDIFRMFRYVAVLFNTHLLV